MQNQKKTKGSYVMKKFEEFTLKDILFFDKMLTPQVVTYLYWFGILMSFIFAVERLFTGFSLHSVIWAVLTFLVGVICTRVFYELLIILFKIYEKLCLIANNIEENENDIIENDKPIDQNKNPEDLNDSSIGQNENDQV